MSHEDGNCQFHKDGGKPGLTSHLIHHLWHVPNYLKCHKNNSLHNCNFVFYWPEPNPEVYGEEGRKGNQQSLGTMQPKLPGASEHRFSKS